MIEISNTPASGNLDRFVAGIQSLLDMYAGYPYLKVLAIILAGMLLAWLLTFIATAVLGLFVRSTRFHWDDKTVAALRGPLFWSIALASASCKIGDYVLLDSGEYGKITHIGIPGTPMLSRDDVEITVPNAIMGNSKIINGSGGPYEKYRIRVADSVANGSDIDRCERCKCRLPTISSWPGNLISVAA